MRTAREAWADYAQVARMNGINPTPFEVWLERQQQNGHYLNGRDY